jgi:proteasome lid subunit RPN8/RPN11
MEACGLLAGVERTGGVGPGSIEAGEMGAGEVGAGEVGAGGAGANGERWRHEDLTVAEVCEVYPAANAALSARLYTVEPKDLLRADRAAERAGWSLIGVWHSHTHSPAYPSPTDIAAAPDPLWHYVVVSLSDTEPVLRSYRIVGGQVREEPVLTRGIAARALGW